MLPEGEIQLDGIKNYLSNRAVKPFASAIGIQGAFLSLVDRVGIFNV